MIPSNKKPTENCAGDWSLCRTLVGVCLLQIVPLVTIVDAQTPDFENDVATILIERCVACHQGPDASGDLRLNTEDGLSHGGESGPVVLQGSPQDSPLLWRVREGEMPPMERGESRKLSAHEIDVLERWIAAGAEWPADRRLDLFERTTDLRAGRDWWSFQPIERPGLPPLSPNSEAQNPIDAFILARLEQHDMVAAPPADNRTLLRRMYYDLIGLPPSQTQIDEFAADASPAAWADQVDALLAMPQYGERWARYWLDLARYADTSGYERDQEKLYAWKYRDWVVNALNDDMPLQNFIVAQVAGDEIEDRSEQSVIATGFLRLGTWNDEPNDPLDYQYDRLEDTVHTTASTFLALTVKCARCHAHKFDPIEQDDYYRMASAFWAGPIGARDRDLLGGPSSEELGFEQILAWTDLTPQPAPLHLLKNGERSHPMQEVVPATLSMIPSLERKFDPPPKDSKTSTRRLQLARWIADPKHPLTARVMVNRIWQHHFGNAIVRTPNNFGFLADPPTHPDLLDWLAAELIDQGSIKRIHKLILTSATWRQSSLHPLQEDYAKSDSSNRLWWRAERRRLDAEAIRDSMLAATGELDLSLGGESFKPTVSPEALEGLSRKSAAWQASPPEKQSRRSLYMYLKRGLLPPMMTAFDLCDATGSCGKRAVTTVPTQALALMNNRFVHDRSHFLAASLATRQSEPSVQIQRAWSLILKRPPTAAELALAMNHLAVQQETFATYDPPSSRVHALASLCHVLLNSNEFIYVD